MVCGKHAWRRFRYCAIFFFWCLLFFTEGIYRARQQTVSVLSAFVLFMVKYPHVQVRAQAEVDTVLGGTRLPIARDIDALPYVRAVISEVLCFGLVAPQGLPHCMREDDIYE